MKFNRKSILWTSISFAIATVILLFTGKTSWSYEFAIFNLKVALVLYALYNITTEEK